MGEEGTLQDTVHQILTSLRVLEDFRLDVEFPRDVVLALHHDLQDTTERDLSLVPLPQDPSVEIPLDAISLYVRYRRGPQRTHFVDSFLTALANSDLVNRMQPLSEETLAGDAEVVFLLSHAQRIAESSLDALMAQYVTQFATKDGALPRFVPAEPLTVTHSVFDPKEKKRMAALLTEIKSRNFFAASWVIDYEGTALAVGEVEGLKPLKQFYGYKEIKGTLESHFARFAHTRQSVRPLLLDGPPGVGKTQLINAYSRRFRNLRLVRAPPGVLNNLQEELDHFGRFTNQRIVLFVDDIDPDEIGWKQFRTIYEGGGQSPPDNVCLVVSSNLRLPDNIKSRCLYVPFRDLKVPEEGYETVAGMIFEYLREQPEAKTVDGETIDRKTLAGFLAQDFYHGEAPPKLAKYWPAGLEQAHDFELSPRGLLQYLEYAPNRAEIMRRIEVYQADERLQADAPLDDAYLTSAMDDFSDFLTPIGGQGGEEG